MTWILPAQLLSRCAQASACSISELTSPSAELGLWATSSGTASLRRSSWSGWKTRPWSRRLFSQAISQASHSDRFADWWTSSLRASRANPTPPPASGPVRPTSGGFGRISSQAFAFLDPASSSWKTSPGSDLLGDWMPFSATWPRSGVVSRGRAFALRRLARRTNEIESSSLRWPTPDAAMSNDGEGPTTFEARRQRLVEAGINGNGMGIPLAMAVKLWPTTTAADSASTGIANNYTKDSGRHSGTTLTDAVRAWATPMAADSRGSAGAGKAELPNQAMNWATPLASDVNGTRAADGKRSVGLNTMTTLWATPAARDHKGSPKELTRPDGKSRLDQLDRQAENFSPRVQAIPDGPQSSSSAPTLPLRLNPVFGCWLMGWPTWWTNPGPTACARSETALWRSRLLWLCDSLCGSSAGEEEAA